MKVLVCEQPGLFAYREMAAPTLQPGHAIIKIKNIGVCGTDLHAFEGTQPYFTYPRILGHELSGELVAFDQAPGFSTGEPVTFIPYLNCKKCIACRNGKPNCCVNIRVCGIHTDGGMAEYFSVPSEYLVHGQGLSYPELALVESLAIGAHGIRKADIRKGDFLLVAGAGPIGLGAIAYAGLAGANVIVMDVNEARLAFCKNKLNVQHTVRANDSHVKEQIAAITNGDMASVVIDASGNQRAINNGINFLAHGGAYILIGLQGNELIFSHPEFHKREATLMSSRNATRDDFDQVIQSMQNGSVKPSDYITDRVQFNDVAGQFGQWLEPGGNKIKVIIEMG